MEYFQLNDEIEQLRYLFMDAKSGHARWKDVWEQVAQVRSGFRGTRYPSPDAQNEAWSRFQSILSEIEVQKLEADRHREYVARSSQSRLAEIIDLAHHALTFDPTSSDMIASIIGLGIPGVNIPLMFEGPFLTKKKKILLTRSNYMKQGWDMFKSHKDDMTVADRSAAFAKLKHAQDFLDREWEDWKDAQEKEFNERKATAEIRRAEKQRSHEEYLERQRVREVRQHEWQLRQADRRRRIEENIDKNVARAARLYAVLEDKAGHLARFESHRDSARTNEFRANWEEKIERISEQISEIRAKIETIEDYIEEDRQKLRDM